MSALALTPSARARTGSRIECAMNRQALAKEAPLTLCDRPPQSDHGDTFWALHDRLDEYVRLNQENAGMLRACLGMLRKHRGEIDELRETVARLGGSL